MVNEALSAEAQKTEVIAQAELEMQVKALRAQLEGSGDDEGPVVSSKEADALGDAVDISRQNYVQLYNTSDGRKVDVLPVMLTAKLSLKWRRGQMVANELLDQPVWSLTPVKRPDNEDLVCDLHPQGRNRDQADALGVTTVCPRVSIPNSFVLKRHMKAKHPDELAILDEHQNELRRDEDRAVQEAHLTALEKLAEASSGNTGITADQMAGLIAAIKGDGQD